VSRWIADDNVNAILITGGIGLTGRDRFSLLGSTGACRTASKRLIPDQRSDRLPPSAVQFVEMRPQLLET
jgi:molybdopterin biosynthesis enzyme MoaB